jgi:hypothetical protein
VQSYIFHLYIIYLVECNTHIIHSSKNFFESSLKKLYSLLIYLKREKYFLLVHNLLGPVCFVGIEFYSNNYNLDKTN